MERERTQKNIKYCIGYVRVSTNMQVDEGVSLEAQQRAIKEWASTNGYKIRGMYSDEGVSGKLAKRDGLTLATTDVQSGEVFVVYSISRLARNTVHVLQLVEELNKNGVNIVSLKEKIDTSNASGKMFLQVVAALAEFESNNLSERVSATIQHKKEQGEFHGRPPYGWKLRDGSGSDLIEDPYEQEVIRIAKLKRKEVEDGKEMSYSKIALYLEEKEYKNRKGTTTWHPQQISRLVHPTAPLIKGANTKLTQEQAKKQQTLVLKQKEYKNKMDVLSYKIKQLKIQRQQLRDDMYKELGSLVV